MIGCFLFLKVEREAILVWVIALAIFCQVVLLTRQFVVPDFDLLNSVIEWSSTIGSQC